MATNFFNGSTVDKALSDNDGNAMLVKCTVANIPSAVSGYAIGCLLVTTDGTPSTTVYVNTGSATSCNFQYLVGGGSLT